MSQETHAQETSRIPGSEDPAERRRILNIQAQRRYRQRKRSRLKELESLAQLRVQQQSGTPSTMEHGQSSLSSSNDHPADSYPVLGLAGATDLLNSNPGPDLLAEAVIEELESLETGGYLGDDNFHFPVGGGESSQETPSSIDFESFMVEIDNQNSEFAPSTYPNEPPRDLGSVSAPDQERRSKAAFADYLITVPGISCIRAKVEIFKVMHGPGFKLEIWNPKTLSPFAIPERNIDHAAYKPSHYPQEFHPTALQRTIQHHPVIDVLPGRRFVTSFSIL